MDFRNEPEMSPWICPFRVQDIMVNSFHVTCDSDTFELGKRYVGLVIYQKDGTNYFRIGNRRLKSGSIIIHKSEYIFDVTPPNCNGQGSIHGKLFKVRISTKKLFQAN